MEQKGFSDADLMDLLDVVGLTHIVDREGGWDSRRDWANILAGGDKQKIAMVRLFYHKPMFAILDECTSAVSLEDEKIAYTHSKEQGISLITISHRASLLRYHDFLLKFDGAGAWKFEKLEQK